MSLQKCREMLGRIGDASYRKREAYLKDPYSRWILQNEKLQRMEFSDDTFVIMKHGDFVTKVLQGKDIPKSRWIIITRGEGRVNLPSTSFCAFFEEDSEYGLIYGDEDMEDSDLGLRYGPWFKPDDSPETLLSFFYYGSAVFLKSSLIGECVEAYQEMNTHGFHIDMAYYTFVLLYTQWLRGHHKKIGHISEIIFTFNKRGYRPENIKEPEIVNESAYWGYEKEFDRCKACYFSQYGIEAMFKEVTHNNRSYSVPTYEIQGEHLVSIIIPSKDNVEVLEKCLRSIREKTEGVPYEIILVDNGSNEENKRKVESLRQKINFDYIYKEMDFNYSRMCNIGVSRAKGDYILLLNDDMEVIEAHWLKTLLAQATQEGIGAVGAKLFYPDSDIIQHVGMTSLHGVGPAHQLVKEHDSEVDYYYGRNTLTYDMIGVTAACLLVAKEIYEEAGGFYEGIEISYNDADFCFTLHEKGYRNVLRNDVTLYHHESLSRGDDRISDVKWERLLREKKKVYDRHPALEKIDPYHNRNLAGYKHKYFCNYLYPYEVRDCFCKVSRFSKKIKDVWYNNAIMITLEHAKLERKLNMAEKDVYWIEGWAYVLNQNQSRYKRELILVHESGIKYKVDIHERFRQDVVDILPKQTNIGLSGFSCRIKRGDLPKGEYTIALFYKDTQSRQRLYKECEKKLIVSF